MKTIIFSVLLFAALASGPAWAEFGAEPEKACSYLAENGIYTRGYKDIGGIWGCSSPYKELDSGIPANNIAYYVEGAPAKATRLKLVLNVNNKGNEQQALNTMVLYSKKLAKSALGTKLADSFITAIKSGKQAVWSRGGVRIKLTREEWRSGRGYTLRLVVD